MIREDIDRVIDQILYDVVNNKTKFTETYREEIINIIVDKLTVIGDEEILKIIQGTPRTRDVFNDITADLRNTAQAQYQHTIKEIRDGKA